MTQFFDNKKDVQAWLNEMGIENYTINKDLTVDVNHYVDLKEKGLKYLPVQFGVISGPSSNFHIDSNELTSLLGSPYEVGGVFNCQNNQLTTLDYLPKTVKHLFCGNNPIQINQPLEVKLDCFYHNCDKEEDRIELFKDLYTFSARSFFDETKTFKLEVWEFFFMKRMNEFKEKNNIIQEASELNNTLENQITHHKKVKL